MAFSYLTDIALDRERGLGAYFLRPVLWIVSLIYGMFVVVIRWFYSIGLLKSFRAPVPVISVGNLTAGGTGKTPFVAMLCRVLREEGFNPMVLMRGYMGDQGGVSDEAEMLRQLIGPGVFTGADRVKSFHSAVNAGHFDCVVLDDGFQHWRFRRDLDIVLIDSSSPFGNGSLIPRGVLRETKRALRRAGVVVLTRADRIMATELEVLKARVKSMTPDVLLFQGVHQVSGARDVFGVGKITVTEISGSACAFCAIGDPESFKRTLESQGIELKLFIPFPDHYRFLGVDVQRIVLQCRSLGLERIFITHKDFVKLKDFRDLFTGVRLIVIDIEFILTYGKIDILSSIRRLRRA